VNRIKIVLFLNRSGLVSIDGDDGCSGVLDLLHKGRMYDIHPGQIVSNLEQVDNLLYTQTNSAYYPQWAGKWVVTHLVWAIGWRPSVAGWVGYSCTAGPTVSYCRQWLAT